jgi:hypothetical protein
MLVLVCFGSRVFLSLALRCSRAVAWGRWLMGPLGGFGSFWGRAWMMDKAMRAWDPPEVIPANSAGGRLGSSSNY